MTSRPPYFSLLLISGAALSYEIILMRLFSIIQWHHFAYLCIGLALLGYALSGTIISIFQARVLKYFTGVYIACVLGFAITAIVCFLVAQRIPFNAEVVLWDTVQLFYLGAIFLLLAIPFLFAASAICMAFMQYGKQLPRLYAMDLVGAGLGSIGIIVMLYWLLPLNALMMIAVLGLFAGLLAIFELGQLRKPLAVPGVVLAELIIIISVFNARLNVSPYKGSPQMLQIRGTSVVLERSSPLGLLQVVESRELPLRHAPGLSLNATIEPLPQVAVFTDSDNMTVLTQYPAEQHQLAYLDMMTSALSYHLRPIRNVLVIGAGGGSEVLQAKYHRVPQIDGVELNPQMIELVNVEFGDFTGRLYQQAGINIQQAEARDFLSATARKYDLIQLAMVDAFAASSSGLYALNESYLYTIEALQQYVAHVNDNGFLSITRWIKLPPRDSLKLFASAVTALQKSGINDPGQRIVMIRSWQTSTLLVKNGRFSKSELVGIRAFCKTRSFDLVYAPDMQAEEANQHNILSEPIFYEGTTALLNEQRESFVQAYKFNLQPATDDQPFFHQFFKWSSLAEIFRLRHEGGMPLIEWGYMTLLATLLVAFVLGSILIILPVRMLQRRQFDMQIARWRVFAYFLSIGLAFLFVEIAIMQRFIRFLHHPVLSIAITLTAFLIFSGLGSAWSGRLTGRIPRQHILLFAIISITIIIGLYIMLLSSVFDLFTGSSLVWKSIISILLIAPLALGMGMPFPLAMSSLSDHAPAYIPWAWGINGFASVISAILATILAIHFGFTIVLILALGFYLATLWTFPGEAT